VRLVHDDDDYDNNIAVLPDKTNLWRWHNVHEFHNELHYLRMLQLYSATDCASVSLRTDVHVLHATQLYNV
jgi:hypothetical protein